MSGSSLLLLHDFNYPTRTGINQNRSIIDDRVTVFANTVFRWNLIVGYARLRKNCAYSHVPIISVRGTVLFDDITPEARTLIHAQNAVYATNDSSDCATNNSSNGPRSPLTFARTTINAFRYSLSES